MKGKSYMLLASMHKITSFIATTRKCNMEASGTMQFNLLFLELKIT